MTNPGQTGRLDFKSEGFSVFWDDRGLRIEVIDYHVGALQLSWEAIFELAQKARSGAPSTTSLPNVGRNPS